ncbi:MAG: selenocysteine-specific translation elongation factor [Pyrinomonadaceae bacterium]
MDSIIIGTAGHIDHGKSSLVQALTGKDPDRLPEEKRRGITIDLGFADLDLGDVRVGFVDVPGHERFVKNMLAGVHGIDAVALVIAADEGVMPQTREHFDICRLLNVRRGLVVITKTDLVEEELLTLVHAEAEELVAGSFLEGAPTVSVSARTGEGLEELRSAIRQIARETPARLSDSVTRLPIDRAFTMKGFGAVVTGTLVSGEIAEADELELLPAGLRVRARGVQVHGSSVRVAQSGQRTAVNLAGVDVASIERGMVIAEAGRLRPVQVIDVQLQMLGSAPRAIRTRSRVRVHIGSAEVLGRVRVLNNRGEIAPGETGFAQLRFESPVVALHDERFVVRSYSPSETIAGGLVLDPFAKKHRGKELAKTHEQLRALMDAHRPARLAAFVESSGDLGLRLADIAARTGWNDSVLSEVATAAKQEGTIVEVDDHPSRAARLPPQRRCAAGGPGLGTPVGTFVARQNFERLARMTLEEVRSHHQREPLSRGLARETLRERHFAHAAPEVFRAVMVHLEDTGALATDRDLVRLSEHSVELSPADTQLRERISAIYEEAGLESPSLEQAFADAGVAPAGRAHGRKILQLLIDNGTLVRVQSDMFIHLRALDHLKGLLRKFAAEHEPARLVDVGTFKDLAGVSRKYAIPLLEYLDREHITLRAGDKRIIV